MRPAVYLAGPDVFRRDAKAHGTEVKRMCLEAGLDPLWPLDNEPQTLLSPSAMAASIRQMNCAMIRRADAVIANISPFRGPNMDPGTAFEIGFAAALQKPTFLYSASTISLLDRTQINFDLSAIHGKLFDVDDMEVEDFGLIENLMIAGTEQQIFETFHDALSACATHF